jgi:deazaflavin-dependent oxidoreductase (nitroreductase family)
MPAKSASRRQAEQTISLCYNVAMAPAASMPVFREPNIIEKVFNRAFGLLVGIGIGPKYIYVLQVRGRKSGKIYSSPVNMVEAKGKKYLVAPRGRTQWVRNIEAFAELNLKRGSSIQRFRPRALSEEEKLPLLKLYLDSFPQAVQRYFPIPAGSPIEAFRPLAGSYPVFELQNL